MKLIYEASNSVEAHMILNLLEQAGLSARIDGEYLQGGIGELQAIGVVRVMVDEADYTEAKAIIEEWGEKQSIESHIENTPKKSSWGTAIVAFFAGVTVMAVYYHTPVDTDGIDYNRDGELDEKWTYVSGRLSKTELDRNFDGSFDFITDFDRAGRASSSVADEDFDGTFETDIEYFRGNITAQESDTTGDGFKDYRVEYKNGRVRKIKLFDPAVSESSPLKIQHFDTFKLKKAEFDSDQDGKLDTVYTYDGFEEVETKFNK